MSNFKEITIQAVWEKAKKVPGQNKDVWRKDPCGAWIKRTSYGKETTYGWHIDHVYPQDLGGKDDLINLRVMQWENNITKGNDYPDYTAAVTSQSNKNIKKRQRKTVAESLRRDLDKLYGKPKTQNK